MFTVFFFITSTLTLGLSTKSSIVIVEDQTDEFLPEFLIDMVVRRVRESSPNLIVKFDRKNENKECGDIRDRNAVHLTSQCADVKASHLALPLVFFPSGSPTWIGMGHSVYGQLKVALELAKQRDWRQIQLWTDDSEVAAVLVRLSFELNGSEVSVRPVPIVDTRTMEDVDSVLVHCWTSSCFEQIHVAFDMQKDSTTTTWMFTEDATKAIQSDAELRKKVSLVNAFGIKRAFPQDRFRQLIELSRNCTLLSQCSENLDDRILPNAVYLHDGLLLLSHLLTKSNESLPLQSIRAFANEIGSMTAWETPVQLDGQLTGRIHPFYEVIDLADPFYAKVAVYNDSALSFTESYSGSMRGKREADGQPECSPVKGPPYHFRISTVEEPPFLFYNRSEEDGLFSGFIVDLLEKLKTTLNFTYKLSLSEDGKYGVFDTSNGTVAANGLVGEVFNCKADLGVAAIGISAERETYLQFTKPWMDYGLMLLGPKPRPEDSGLFAFLDPFTTNTWILIIVCLFVTALVLPLLQIVSPSDVQKEEEEAETVENWTFRLFSFKLYDSIWLFYTTSMQQGPEGALFLPAKILLAVWYFTVLIIIATYTANLAAFLTFQRIPEGINSVDQLAEQTEILYGTVEDSAVAKFFRTSPIQTYYNMGKFMSNEEGAMVSNGLEGINLVRNSTDRDYVFIWDSPVQEYFSSHQPCNTKLIGRVFNRKGYGIVMPRGMPYLHDFTLEILKLRDSGWIKQRSDYWLDAGGCAEDGLIENSDTGRVAVTQMGGVFLVLAVGICIAFLVAVSQWAMFKFRCLQFSKKAFKKHESRVKHVDFVVANNGFVKPEADDPVTAV